MTLLGSDTLKPHHTSNYKPGKIIVEIVLSILFLPTHPPFPTNANAEAGQNTSVNLIITSDNPIPVREEPTPYLVFIGILTIIATTVVAVVVIFLQGWYERKHISNTSGLAILSELKDNINELVDKRNNKNDNDVTSYPLKDNNENPVVDEKGNTKVIFFTRYFLDVEAYSSVLFSGSFIRFPLELQHDLTNLYNIIKMRNELLTYRNHFQDNYFLNIDSDERRKNWFIKIRRYDKRLTALEQEIIDNFENIRKYKLVILWEDTLRKRRKQN
jgi:hypothetical protein